MAFTAADLLMVDNHIALGERHVARQKELIAWLKSKGHPTEMAEQLLNEFEATLVQHREHRELMLHQSEADHFNITRSVPIRQPKSGSPKTD